MKKLLILFLSLIFVFSIPLYAFGETQSDALEDSATGESEKDYSHLKGGSVSVYNWGEYMSDGSEGSLNVIKEFEQKYEIKVEYSTFDHNEEMHAKIAGGGTNYDLIIPSDYMIERMIKEDMLEKLNFENIPNYKYILPKYKNLFFDPKNEYTVPYTAGMVGIIYNKTMVEGEPDSWNLMWNEKYKGEILNFYNPRDVFATAQFLLGQDVNTTSKADWDLALEKLLEQKPLIQNYVMDEIFNKMEKGEAAIAAYYAGDYLSMYENNEDLMFFYPKEGTNIFVDSMCIPKGAENKEAAELFINFMLSQDIAVANSNFICYASPNSLVLESDDYDFKDNEFLYPNDEDIEVEPQYFHDLPSDTLSLMHSHWEQLGISGTNNKGIYIALILVVVLAIAAFVYAGIKKKRRA